MFKKCINCKRGSKILKELYLYRTKGEISKKSVIFEKEISEEEKKEFLKYCISDEKINDETIRAEKKIEDSIIATEILRVLAHLPKELGAKRRKELLEKWGKNVKSIGKIQEFDGFEPNYIYKKGIKNFIDDMNKKVLSDNVGDAEFLERLEAECIKIAEYEKNLKLDDVCLWETVNIIITLNKIFEKDLDIEDLAGDLVSPDKVEFKNILLELNNFNEKNKKNYNTNKAKKVLKLIRSKDAMNGKCSFDDEEVVNTIMNVVDTYFSLINSKNMKFVYDTQASCFLKTLKENARNYETEKERESTEMNKIYEIERFVRRMHELPIEDLNYIKRYLKEATKNFDVCLAKVLEYRKMNHNQLAKRLGITLSSLKSMITSENSKKLDKYIDEIYKILRIDNDVLKKGYGKVYDVSSDHEKGCWIEKDFIRSEAEREIPKHEETKNLSQEEIEEYVDFIRYYYLEDKDNAELVLHLMETK